jgi:hypothetical protein
MIATFLSAYSPEQEFYCQIIMAVVMVFIAIVGMIAIFKKE